MEEKDAEITFLPTNTSEIHLHVEHSYRTPTKCWQKTSDFPKGKKIPRYLGRAKEKRKNRDTKQMSDIKSMTAKMKNSKEL